jgi:hypothetical protein
MSGAADELAATVGVRQLFGMPLKFSLARTWFVT